MAQQTVSDNLLRFIREHSEQIDKDDFAELLESSDFGGLSARDTGMFAQIAFEFGVSPLDGKGVTDIPDYWFGGGYNNDLAVIPINIKKIRACSFYARSSFPLHIRSIKYQGTRDQFNQIEKEEGWSDTLQGTPVYCTDGQIIL